MNWLLRQIFDRASTRWTRIVACAVVGLVFGAMIVLRRRIDGITWWQLSLGCGFLGAFAGLLLTLYEIARNHPSGWKRKMLYAAVFVGGFVVAIISSIVIIAVSGR